MLCEWILYCSWVVTVIQLYAAQYYVCGYYIVHVSSLWYSYMQPNVMYVVIILFMCRYCDTFKCSPMLCMWLLYFTYVVTVIQLNAAQYYVCGYYIFRMSSLWYSYMQPNAMYVVIILFMCRHSDIVICSVMLCECLLYCSCVVTWKHINVTQYSVSGYYIVHVSSLWYCYMQPNVVSVY